MQATAFLAHPYGIPTIGWPSDIASWRIEDLKTFFTTNYAPNNCTLVLVGDVDAEERDRAGAQVLRADSRAGAAARRSARRSRRNRASAACAIEAEAQTPLVQFAYHALAGADPRQPALDLLTRILTDGDASRLHRVLVEEQKLAISADSYVDRGFDPGLVWFLLVAAGGRRYEEGGSRVHQEIERLRHGRRDREELARARNQALADFWRGLATIDGKAQALGEYAVLHGGYQRLFDAPRAYESVTPQDIQKLAAELAAARQSHGRRARPLRLTTQPAQGEGR